MISRPGLRLLLCLALLCPLLSCSETLEVDVTPPGRVTDLRVTETTTSHVRLAWTAPGDNNREGTAAEYDIRYSVSGLSGSAWDDAVKCEGEPAPAKAGTAEGFYISGLSASTAYYFALRTRDEAGNWSDLSDIVEATTPGPDEIAPATVTDLRAGKPTWSSIELTWTSTGDDSMTGMATAYDLRYSTVPIDTITWHTAFWHEAEQRPPAPGRKATVRIRGLSSGTTYYFAVKIVDEWGNRSGLSNIASTTTLDYYPPAAVDDLAAQPEGAHSITLSWTATGADSLTGRASWYDIRYSENPIDVTTWPHIPRCESLPTPQPVGLQEAYILNGVVPNTTYYFVMRVADSLYNWSGLSNMTQTTTHASTLDSVPPGAITDLDPAIHEAGVVHLRWTATGDDGHDGVATGYEVRFMKQPISDLNWEVAPTAPDLPLPAEPGTVQKVRVGYRDRLQSRTVYYFAIKAKDEESNWSDISNVASIKTPYCEGPCWGAWNAADFEVYQLADRWLKLHWGKDPAPYTYDIRQSLAPIDDWNWDDAEPSSGRFIGCHNDFWNCFKVTELSVSTTYHFGVRQISPTLGMSSISVCSATTLEYIDWTPPAEVTDLVAEPSGSAFVILRWTATGNDGHVGTAAAYDIRYSTAPINESWYLATRCRDEPSPQPSGSRETFVVSGLTPGPVYYFALKVSDQTPNWSGLSNMAHATTHVDTGDVTPPSPVTDLEPAVHKVGVIHLRWTVPGDDGGSEYASGYDVRYSKAPFDEAAWETAIEAEYEPTPGEPGSVQTFKVSNLDPSTTYYFAMKVRDDVFNWSDISNTVSIQTAPCGGDCYPPSTGGVEVLGVTSRSLRLEWFLSEMIEWPLTYEFRMSMSPIDDWNLSEATPFNALVQYRQAGTISKYAYILVDNLSPNTTYFFSVRGADSYSNWGPAEYTSATTKYSDDPNPSGPAKFALHLEEHAGRSCGSGLPSIGTRYEIANRVDHELPYDIDVFVVVFGISGIRAAEYGLAWPSTWGTGVTSHCAAISLGDIVNSGDGLVLGWGDCQVANPVLPLSWTWLTAGEPGGIQIVAYPANQSLGVAACDCTGVAADSVFHAGVNTDPPGITIWTGGALSSWDRVRSLLE